MTKKLLYASAFFIFGFWGIAPAHALTTSGGTSLSDPFCVSFESEVEYDANVPANYTLGFYTLDVSNPAEPTPVQYDPISTTVELHSGEPQLGPHCFPIGGLSAYNPTDYPTGVSFGMWQPGTQSYADLWQLTGFMQTYLSNIDNGIPNDSPASVFSPTDCAQAYTDRIRSDAASAFPKILSVLAGMLGLVILLALFGKWLNRNR